MIAALGALVVSFRGIRRNDFDSLRDELRKQLGASSHRVTQLEVRVADLEDMLEGAYQKITRLEQVVNQLTTWRRVAVAYIHTLQQALRAAGVPVPDAPVGLDLNGEKAGEL